MDGDTSKLIQTLNDQFRTVDETIDIPGTFLITAGLSQHALDHNRSALDVMEIIQNYNDFTEESDPHGEHDFGVFTFEQEKCFWKIDYYADDSLTSGSENPADIANCYRCLTVLLASEY